MDYYHRDRQYSGGGGGSRQRRRPTDEDSGEGDRYFDRGDEAYYRRRRSSPRGGGESSKSSGGGGGREKYIGDAREDRRRYRDDSGGDYERGYDPRDRERERERDPTRDRGRGRGRGRGVAGYRRVFHDRFDEDDFERPRPGQRYYDRLHPPRYQQHHQHYQQQHYAPTNSRYQVPYYPPSASYQPALPASAYEPILCPRYNWSQPDCRDQANCKLLHICRSWLGGECTKADCRLSHSLADDHNWPKFISWLTEQDREEMASARESAATNHRLRSWLFDKLPKICPSSLVPRLVCTSPRCKDLHVCVNIVKTGQCKYRQHCASPYHSLFTQRNLDVLRQHYPSIAAHVDPARPIEEQAWLSDVLKNDMDKPAPAGFDEHHFKLRGLTIDTVQLCVNYGEGRGDCQSPGCRDLHVCRAWLGGACPNGRSCRWVHGFTRDVMLRLEPLAEGRPLTCQYNIRDNLKVVFPCTCCYYNTERGCQRGANNCDYLHLCNEYVRGKTDCPCDRNHDPYDMSVPHRLTRKGVNASEKDERVLLRNVLYADFRLKRPCPVCSGGRGSSSSSSSGVSRSRSRSKTRSGSKSRSRSQKHSRSRSASRRQDHKPRRRSHRESPPSSPPHHGPQSPPSSKRHSLEESPTFIDDLEDAAVAADDAKTAASSSRQRPSGVGDYADEVNDDVGDDLDFEESDRDAIDSRRIKQPKRDKRRHVRNRLDRDSRSRSRSGSRSSGSLKRRRRRSDDDRSSRGNGYGGGAARSDLEDD